MRAYLRSLAVLATLAILASPSPAQSPTTLREAYAGAFLVGGTLNEDVFWERDAGSTRLAAAQFNAVSPENVLKWERVHPQPGSYAFDNPDRYVAWARDRGMYVVGHTLVWHNQTPRWVFEKADGAPVSRDTLVARLRDHIRTVVGRYKGRIDGWDVVNEALNEDGTLRETPWLRIIGPEYIEMAFRLAHEADPEAKLWYNDFSLENPAKRAGAVRLVKGLLDKGVPVAGVGMQGHLKLDWPTPEAEDSTIKALGALGVRVMITELDIDVLPRVTRSQGADVNLRVQGAPAPNLNPFAAGLPDSVQQRLAQRYAAFFRVFLENRYLIDRVTFWGVADGTSWLNDWPIRGRTNHPLLFDRQLRAKPAFDAVMSTARQTLVP